MSKYIVIKTFIIEAKDIEEAKQLANDVEKYRILEIYKVEEDGT